MSSFFFFVCLFYTPFNGLSKKKGVAMISKLMSWVSGFAFGLMLLDYYAWGVCAKTVTLFLVFAVLAVIALCIKD